MAELLLWAWKADQYPTDIHMLDKLTKLNRFIGEHVPWDTIMILSTYAKIYSSKCSTDLVCYLKS